MEEISEKVNEIINNKIAAEVPTFPKKNLLIEVTNICNNACIFCANRKMTREKKMIDENLAIRVLEECYELGTRQVGFYATGEPLLNDKLEVYIKKAKSIGYEYIYLTTNGLLADKDRINSIFDAGLDSIKFSINAIEKNAYKFIHAVDCFDKIVNNLRNTYLIKKEKYPNIKVSVSYIKTKYTNENNETIKTFFEDICDEVVISEVKNQGGLLPEIDKMNIGYNDNIKLPCFYVFNSLTVTCEGYLSACCMDFQNYLAYADLNKNSMIEAWTNECITKFRKRQIAGDVNGTICENCINGTCKKIHPINEELATRFETDQMYSETDFEERISNFKNIK